MTSSLDTVLFVASHGVLTLTLSLLWASSLKWSGAGRASLPLTCSAKAMGKCVGSWYCSRPPRYFCIIDGLKMLCSKDTFYLRSRRKYDRRLPNSDGPSLVCRVVMNETLEVSCE